MPDNEKKEKNSEKDVVFENEIDNDYSALQKAKKALKVCEKEKKEYLDGWKRARADALNEKKRQQDFLQRERDAVLRKCVLAILPVLDSVQAARSQPSDDTAAQAGITRIHTQCLQALSGLNVTVIDSAGEVFDPHQHQSVGERAVSSKKEDNTVVEIMRVGACAGDMVIRPAMVYIGVYKKEEKTKDK